MPYNIAVKVYYSDNDNPQEEKRLIPAPLISISPEILYANDTAIGYTYSVTLDGYATALDLSTYAGGELDFTNTIQAIKKIRDIFSVDQGILVVKQDNKTAMTAIGGKLESLEFTETDNNWFNYAKYTAKISFDNLVLNDCLSSGVLIDCKLPEEIEYINSPYLVDMKKYNIKSVNDEWTIDANDNIYLSDLADTQLDNSYLDITYTIQAVGKSYISSQDTTPAWQQSKRYCIDRLKQEIGRLKQLQIGPLQSILKESTCSHTISRHNDVSATQAASVIYQAGEFNIYNETIETNMSESDGSFSLTYKSILKNNNNNSLHPLFKNQHCIHKINKTTSVSNQDLKTVLTKSIEGEIQGLVQGGLIENLSVLQVPNTGFLLDSGAATSTKYENALSAFNQIYGGSDLGIKGEIVVDIFNIRRTDFDITAEDSNEKPKISSSSILHNYNEGIITYSEEYNNQNIIKNTGIDITSITLSVEEGIHHTAEFIVPGRLAGPIIQKFTSKTPKRINISFDGISLDRCPIFGDICTSGLGNPRGLPGTGIPNYEITQNTHNFNYRDGSFTINRSYIYIGAEPQP